MAGSTRCIVPALQSTLKRLLLPPVALVLAACAAPSVTLPPSQSPPNAYEPVLSAAPRVLSAEEQALQGIVALQDRLYRVAAPLLINNTPLCKGSARNLLGFTAKTKYSYSSDYVDAAQSLLKLDDRLQVMGVLTGSGAARAGLRRGDILIAVEDKPLPGGEYAEREAAAVLAPLMNGRSSVRLTVLRDGVTLPLTVPLTHACAFGVEVGHSDDVNAYADGYRILLTRGMMNALRSDEELAYVVAKEMAHNVLGHPSRQRTSATAGGIIDNLTRVRPDMGIMVGLAGMRPMPQELDAVADRLSLYMLARAGYPVEQAVPFWQRMAAQYPATQLNTYTALHPATAYRVAAMEKTLADIKAKRAAKKPLVP